MTDTDAPISVNLSGTRTGDEAEWAFNAAQSWLRRDEPQVGQRYTYREGGWIVSLQRKPLTIIAAFRYIIPATGNADRLQRGRRNHRQDGEAGDHIRAEPYGQA